MTTVVSIPPTRPQVATQRLVLVGALAGPLFCVAAAAQILTREGFDITRHPISLLSTGSLGWVQIATFIMTGIGEIALAVAFRRAVVTGVGRRAVPILLGIFGVGIVAAGVFTMDPEYGFPLGTPEGPAAEMSWHSLAHTIATAGAFTALAVAAIALTVRHIRRRAVLPAVLNAATALILLAPMSTEHMSVQIAVNGLVGFSWSTAVALSLRQRVA